MKRGEIALLVPTQSGLAGGRKVADALRKKGVKPLATGQLVLVPWNSKTKPVIESPVGARALHTDRISRRDLDSLPREARRIGEVWNWTLNAAAKQVKTGAVMRFLESLDLEIKGDQVYDRREKVNLGKVRSEEKQGRKGNWVLCQSRGWTMIPGWFGWWEKLYCWSRNYPGSTCGGSYQNCDFVSAQVDGPNHYGYQARTNAPLAYAEDWTYIWVGMTRGGRAYSFARRGSSTRQITSPNMWPHY